jgi:hypothetical protein
MQVNVLTLVIHAKTGCQEDKQDSFSSYFLITTRHML